MQTIYALPQKLKDMFMAPGPTEDVAILKLSLQCH